jgi:hypothetical protein
MFCPRCGQQQINEETRFCSRCGFLMTSVTELIANGGALPQYFKPKGTSPRKKGVKQGAMLFFSGILLVPLLAIIVVGLLNFEGYLVGIVALLTFLGGILRMIFALLFESSDPSEKTLEENVYQSAQTLLNKRQEAKGLPPQQSIPVSTYVPPVAGNWRDTNDLKETPSVTEHTTKHLDMEKKTE